MKKPLFVLFFYFFSASLAFSVEEKNCDSCQALYQDLELKNKEKSRLEVIFDRNMRSATASNVGGASVRIKLRSNLEVTGQALKEIESKISSLHEVINKECSGCPLPPQGE